ncbi:hypothetical protein C0W54_21180 [Photobacterium kishitanii]|uniref:phospholipase D-like domain-containing protein n=1 Tax=Photobacterium kishitanii TaxID=318456 RepID=UPI000D17B31C|nr:phospholipase D-like domain-containing protein [Photobacterium kishitanii]PSW58777.1 hypothetical protein C0W54_21180 [Photobacterium kishitanii]
MSDRLEKMMKKLEGDGPIEKHIMLLKLTELQENSPDFGNVAIFTPTSPQRQWISKVGALLSRLSVEQKLQYQSTYNTLAQYWKYAIIQIQGQVLDAIEKIKLDLELDDRSEIGSAYAPGDVYRFYSDLKNVINSAEHSVLIIDPYFDGESFNAYLSTLPENVEVKILSDRYSKDVSTYVDKHQKQYGSNIQVRRSKELHDRIIFVDSDMSWIIGGSIKDAGKKATYLIPLQSEITTSKLGIYGPIWDRASVLEVA